MQKHHRSRGNVYVPSLHSSWIVSATALPWIVLGVLFWARASAAMGYQSSGSLLPMLIPAIGINFTQAGMLVGAFLLPGAFLSLPAGWLAKRWGDERVLLLGLVILIAGQLWLMRTDSLNTALMARAVSGAGAAAVLVMVSKILSDWFVGAALMFPMMILVNSWPLGIGVALQVQPTIGLEQGWQAAVAWSTVPAALAFLLTWGMRDTLRRRTPMVQQSTDRAGGEAGSKGASKAGGSVQGQVGNTPSRWSPQVFMLTSIAYAIFGGIWAVIFSFSASFLIAEGMQVMDASHWIAIVSWCAVPVAPVAGWMARRAQVASWLGPGCFAISAVLLLSLPAWGRPEWALVLVGIVGCIPGGLLNAQAAQSLPPERRAVGLGLFWSSYFAGLAIIPVLAGHARELTGLGSAPLLTAGALAAVAALIHTAARWLETAQRKERT